MRHYATACHRNQVPVLVASMRRHCRPFTLHVLAWDFDEEDAAVSEPGAEVWYHPRGAFLEKHPDYRELPGRPRNANETVCTVRWAFVCDLLALTGSPVTLVDGDQWFWSSPEPVYAEIGNARCAVSPHGFAPASAGFRGVTLESHGKYGRYNGGWSYWRDPRAAARIAELTHEGAYLGWREMPNGRSLFGDQGLLEIVEEEFGAHVVRHPGLNVAPWNVHRWQPRLKLITGERMVFDGAREWPLITYHYSSFRPNQQYATWDYEVTEFQARLLYDPYMAALQEAAR